MRMLLSPKYKAFLKHNARVEFLEGTTYSGKTTTGIVKFMLKIADSPKKLHVLSGLDLGTIEKNIINKQLGLIDVFGYENRVEYNPSGRGEHSLPHILYRTPWIYVNTLDKNLGFLLISATIDNPNINAQGFLPEGEELKAS